MQSLRKTFDIPEPEMGAPLPVMISSEYNLSICYYQAKTSYRTNEIITNADISKQPSFTTILRFKRPYVWKFGMPNENGQLHHPLAKIGLLNYHAFEIENSQWAKRLISTVSADKHFIVLFHDSTLEVIAESYSVHSSKFESVMAAGKSEIDLWCSN